MFQFGGGEAGFGEGTDFLHEDGADFSGIREKVSEYNPCCFESKNKVNNPIRHLSTFYVGPDSKSVRLSGSYNICYSIPTL